ncbi:ABC transporter permease [uncultured Chitinophaga sp.]|uniref:ABC transporter permease n=1 Tax=uncultured Chitinophaga sp. TaxID=339340 RepID=UPI0025E7B6EA|nr:ABC transporter permease [uncultured Chitinophaga sp.]
MLKNYFKIAWRNLRKNRIYSAINITGFAVGMAVAILIGLWIWDEYSFNKYHANYDRIAQIWTRATDEGKTEASSGMPVPMGTALKEAYGSDLEYVVMSSPGVHNISYGDNKLSELGNFMGEDAPDMLTLEMISGSRAGLKDPYSILLSEKTANVLFGQADPVGKVVTIDNRIDVKVTGVYKNLPENSGFHELNYITPWKLMLTRWQWVKDIAESWDFFAFSVYVQIAPHTSFEQLNKKIKPLVADMLPEAAKYKVEVFAHPMSRWRLFSEFKNGVSTGGLIQFVKLFGTIGLFVLLLAVINFMNLSTARSEKRAKEVGIRKAVGSLRSQLVSQFFAESILVSMLALVVALLLAQLALPLFNDIAGKHISILWSSPLFWAICAGFSLFAGIIAGSYPAAYLSSFQPVKVLKGTFRVGRYASVPRKLLVVVQFIVSVLLITGTITVYRQIQFAKNRPVGYNREGLISIQMTTPDIYDHYLTIADELKRSGVALAVSQSQGPITDVWSGSSDFEWKGKDPATPSSVALVGATHGYGAAVGWQIVQGRDFSPKFASDSSGVILNEAAVKYMGLKNPIGETIRWKGEPFIVTGVIKDMVMKSPYEPVYPSIYYILKEPGNFVNIRLNPANSTSVALAKIGDMFKQYNPKAPFDYTFASEEYGKKFADEERIGQLAFLITLLAILISCLGLLGLASFMAEQRTKEIGIRKVLGASVMNLWGLLSKEFLVLVVISCIIASPVAYYFLHQWLERYTYRIAVSWWIFAMAGSAAILVTLLTVSTQTIKAALANPVRSLRSE